MNELPEGWTNTTLGEICSKPQYGWTSKASSEGRIKYVRTTDISNGQINWDGVPYCELEPDDVDKFRVREDDILVSRAGSVGVSFRIRDVPYDAVFASYLIRFNSLECVLPKYVEYFLKSSDYWRAISEFSAGIAVPNVNASKLAQLEIPVPPINEQRRIVPKLQKLLSRVDAAQARLATIPRILKRFRQSVLDAACSGRLTADWRREQNDPEPAAALLQQLHLQGKSKSLGDNGSRPNALSALNYSFQLPTSWEVTDFLSVVASIRGGSTAVPENAPTSFPILRSCSVRPGLVDLEDVKYLSSEASQNSLNYLSEGDLLFTRLSGSLEYVANCAKVRGLKGRRIQYPDRLFCAKVLPPMNSSYCELVFAAPFVRAQVVEHAKSSAGHQRVSIVNITDQLIPVPPLAEQQEVVRRVEALFKTADALETRYRKAKAHVDKLTQSILAKAFRGELVPQDPNDEPATVLLERIRKMDKEKTSRKLVRPKRRRASAS